MLNKLRIGDVVQLISDLRGDTDFGHIPLNSIGTVIDFNSVYVKVSWNESHEGSYKCWVDNIEHKNVWAVKAKALQIIGHVVPTIPESKFIRFKNRIESRHINATIKTPPY